MMNGLCLGTCSSRGGREEYTPAAGGIHHRICVGEYLVRIVEWGRIKLSGKERPHHTLFLIPVKGQARHQLAALSGRP